ncbi:uncharacterized protein [Atheta coriaria]|uniref:uncharacterized protein n=1 Tax=Dalotia coriaria TaxID=877792 RepID=UPI0031F3F2EB
MESDFYGLQKDIWKFIRRQRSDLNEIIKAEAIDDDTWSKYLSTLYSSNIAEVPTDNTRNIPDIRSIEVTNIDQDDVTNALRNLKNRKSAGRDQIPNELLKYGGTALIEELTKLFSKILKNQKIPAEWKVSILILMFKKGARNDPNNYRGITLLSTTLKLLTKIITNNLLAKTSIAEEQQGFRTEPTRCKLELEGKVIEQVSQFTYLGIPTTSYGDLYHEVLQQTIKANKIAGCLKGPILRNKHISKQVRGRIYKAVIRPIMTYTSETRADTSKIKSLMETSEMRTLRTIEGTTLRDRIPSKQIRERCKVKEINEWIQHRRSEWNNHISRMETTRIVE